MSFRGHVSNGVVQLDEPITLPEGAEVVVDVIAATPASNRESGSEVAVPNVDERLAAIWSDVPMSEWAKLPADLSDQLDHYLYGTPKK